MLHSTFYVRIFSRIKISAILSVLSTSRIWEVTSVGLYYSGRLHFICYKIGGRRTDGIGR